MAATRGVPPGYKALLCFTRPRFLLLSRLQLMDAFEPKEKTKRAIAFCAYNGHCYMYKSAKAISQWNVAADFQKIDGEEPEHEVLQNETRTKLPPVDDWQRFTGTPEPGNFFYIRSKSHTKKAFRVWEVSKKYFEEWD